MLRRRAKLTFAALLAVTTTTTTATAGRGGPDSGGWAWADSAEPFVDATIETPTSMTTLVPLFPDEGVFPVTLPFPFTLYGVTSSTIWVSSNGWLSLVNPGAVSAPNNRPLPEAGTPNAVLAYTWDDMTDGFLQGGPTPTGYLLLARHFVKSGGLTQTYIQFYNNGSVKVVWIANPPIGSMTIGIENDGTAGGIATQLLFDGTVAPGTSFGAGYAVLFYPPASPDCTSAIPIACGAAVAGSTGGGSDINRFGCGAKSYAGSESVYEITLSGLQGLDVSLTGLGARDLDVFVLTDRCDGTLGCLGGGADAASISVLGTGTYYIVVDGVSATDDGPFNLTVGCTPLSTPIACGATVAGSATGASRFDGYGCRGSGYTGSESIWSFSLAAPATVLATLTSTAAYDLFLADQSTLIPGSTPCLTYGDSALGYINLPAGDYALVVDGVAGTSGPFNLELECSPGVPASTIRCGEFGVAGSNTGPSFIDWYSTCGFGAYYNGEAFYRFTPTARVIATATQGSGIGYDLFSFRESDLPDQCSDGDPTSVTVANLAGPDHIFVMDSNSTVGPTSLALSCRTMVTTDLPCNTTLSGVTSASSDIPGYSCRSGLRLDGGEAYFVFNNPVRQSFAVGVDGAVDLDVIVLEGPFDPQRATCTAGGDKVARMTNAPPGEYLIVVDGDVMTSRSGFDVSITCGNSALDCAAAPPLTCNSVIAGDTTLGTSGAAVYGIADELFSGPELVYTFVQPGPGNMPVNFLLRNPSDARLDLLLIDACDPSRVIEWDDEALIAPNLPPGTYHVVVDGRAGVGGTFDLVSFCNGPALDPPVLTTTLDAGECYTETKRLFFPPTVPIADVMFSFDLSGSMDQELDQVKRNASDLYTALSALIPSLQFGLASFVEYPTRYTSAGCAHTHVPSAPSPWPFRLEIPLTTDIVAVDLELQTLAIIGGAEETYTRTFYEAWANPAIGWRGCARKLWLSIGDEPPMDCNIYECLGGSLMNNGRDPGPNLIPGDADDLELLPTVDNMAANGITLLPIDSSESAEEIAMWDCLAARTGGRVFTTDRRGIIPGGVDIVDGLVGLIVETIRPCPEVRLVPTGPYAGWVTISPGSYSSVLTPFYGEFTIDFCVPPGTLPGVFPISVEARCVGGGSCATELLATQQVEIEVAEPCPVAPVAAAATPPEVCDGEPVTLDGTASSACGPAGLEYRWLDPTATELPGCGWSTTPTCLLTTPAGGTYTLEVRCIDSPDCAASTTVFVEPVPYPTAVLEPLPTICIGDTVTLAAGASDPRGCPVPLEYQFRNGATILRPWGVGAVWPVTPTASTTYTVEVRCTASPGCMAAATQSVVVVPPPTAEAGANANVCEGVAVVLDAAGSTDPGCPSGLEYQWSVGAVPVSPWSSLPTFSPPTSTAGTTVYTLDIRCVGLPDCAHLDTVSVVVRVCGLAVHYDYARAAWADALAPAAVEVVWRTLLEDGTVGFVVERGPTAAGPFAEIAMVDAQGAGYSYRLVDDMPAAGSRPWYRVIELTVDGGGDATPVFQVAEPPAPGGGKPGGRRLRGRAVRD